MRARLIPILLLDSDRRLVKTVGFDQRTYIGDPFNVLRLFNEREVDEICILDIDATAMGRGVDVGLISELCSECFMPLAYGGGLNDLKSCEALNRVGVDKFVLGAAAGRPEFLKSVADTFGSQAVVGCVDVRGGLGGTVAANSGKITIAADPVAYAQKLERSGAGEILLQSIDLDGHRQGLDLKLIEFVSKSVGIPVIAAGGAGDASHFAPAVRAGASAIASGSAFSFIGNLRAVLISYPDRLDVDPSLELPENIR
jgi:cyclase